MPDRRAHESGEERMGPAGFGLEFRMELDRNEPRMILQLDDLHQVAARVHAAHHHPRLLQPLDVGVVDLETVRWRSLIFGTP